MGKRRETKGDDPYQEEYDLIMSQVDDLNKVGGFAGRAAATSKYAKKPAGMLKRQTQPCQRD
jgi:hypothetical protein